MTSISPESIQNQSFSTGKDAKRLPSLDGWRALSILMVLGAHCQFTYGFPAFLHQPFEWLFDGGLGVRFFFLISGFLITWLMLSEHDTTGGVNLRAFYVRRAFRILPVYFAFLATIGVLQLTTGYSQDLRAWFGNLTFTANFIDSAFTTAHLWSLSTEEQFYILWPTLFVLASVGVKTRNAWMLLVIPVMIAPVSRVMGYTGHPAILHPVTRHFSFFSFFDSLAVGCAAAFFLSRKTSLAKAFLSTPPFRALVLGTTLVLIPYALMRLHVLRPAVVPLGYTVQALGFAVLLLQSVICSDWGPYRLLNKPLITDIGVLSYSIYIWQQIFCTSYQAFGLAHPVWWLSFPGWLLPVFTLATISYYGLERPFLRLRARFRTTKNIARK